MSEPTAEARDLAIYVCWELRFIGAEVRNESVTTDSIYVRFEDSRIGQLRIADHKGKRDRKGREKYRYKWNLIKGRSEKVTDRGIVRRFYDWNEVDQMIEDIKRVAHNKRSGLS